MGDAPCGEPGCETKGGGPSVSSGRGSGGVYILIPVLPSSLRAPPALLRNRLSLGRGGGAMHCPIFTKALSVNLTEKAGDGGWGWGWVIPIPSTSCVGGANGGECSPAAPSPHSCRASPDPHTCVCVRVHTSSDPHTCATSLSCTHTCQHLTHTHVQALTHTRVCQPQFIQQAPAPTCRHAPPL